MLRLSEKFYYAITTLNLHTYIANYQLHHRHIASGARKQTQINRNTHFICLKISKSPKNELA